MSEPFCGLSEPPEGSRRGTAKECIDKGQVRYYGIEKFDKKLMNVPNMIKLKENFITHATATKALAKRFKTEKEVLKSVKAKNKGDTSKEALKQIEMRRKAVKKTIKQHATANTKLQATKKELIQAKKDLAAGGSDTKTAKAKKGIVKKVETAKATKIKAVKVGKATEVKNGMSKKDKKMMAIKKKIDGGYKVFWFKIEKKKAVLIAKGKTKTEAGKNILSLISEDKPKWEGQEVWRLILKTHDINNQDDPVYGHVSVGVDNYVIEKNGNQLTIKGKQVENKFGTSWFTGNFLDREGWKNKYIQTIASKLASGKSKMKLIGQNFYDVKFE